MSVPALPAPTDPTHALVFANGDANHGPSVQHALDMMRHGWVLAADGGARLALGMGLVPHILVGDLDSLTEDEVAALADCGVSVERHPPDKAETDLEIALKVAVRCGAHVIRVVGALGDRADQTLANMLLLALPDLAGCDVRLVARAQQLWLLRPGAHTLHGQPGDTLSLLPIGGDALGVHTEGLVYPLHRETLTFGQARGVSNVLAAPHASIAIETGLLLAVHTGPRLTRAFPRS